MATSLGCQIARRIGVVAVAANFTLCLQIRLTETFLGSFSPAHFHRFSTMNLLFLAVIAFLPSPVTLLDLDYGKCVIWGPGLGESSLPVKYFFVQLVNKAGENITDSHNVSLDVQLKGENCRNQLEQLNAGDGSIIVRYRIQKECRSASIHIKYHDHHLGESPYNLPGAIFPDACSCPLDMDEFLSVWQCPKDHPQIEEDLFKFAGINFTHVQRKMLDHFAQANPGTLAMCQYVIKSGKVFRRCFGIAGFSMFMDAILLSVLRKVKLPDMEMFVNLGDWPMSRKGGRSRTTGPWPIFSWCGSSDSHDIVMPTYDITESTLEAMRRVSLDILSVQKAEKPWSEKMPRGFFRGRDASRERLLLTDLSRQHPDLLDSAITNYFFFRDAEEKYGKSQRVPFFRFFHHKYQVSMDGTVAAYRLPYLLAGDSVVLKQESPFYEHFYGSLKPMVHYIPFRRDLSDLISKLQWAKAHDAEARKIAQNARAFVRENLLPAHIFCYHVLLFRRWSELTTAHVVSVTPEMESVHQESPECSCDRKSPRDEL
ncbi:protein O-glucosyltransferase 2-like [Phlebotomus argentipes]|uniref:protein O-glucosyltransferase 2-like n=1 Tax=Phlebotomus argentipes TaxID=94469 RepID=UPI002892FD7E|nr:protein O-glucosyltransferase 2-like [Phlebotomus argentipes]